MKLGKALTVIGLAILISLSPVNLSQAKSSCPLPPETAVTFLNSQCQAVELSQSQTFYRYYSDAGNRYGRFLTRDRYEISSQAIAKLALNQQWGNKATMRERVILPAGMTVYQGLVAPQIPQDCYPGGGEQTFIKDSRDSRIRWLYDGYLEPVPWFVCQWTR